MIGASPLTIPETIARRISGPVPFWLLACERALLFGQAKRASRERAFSRDSFHSPKQESSFAGYLVAQVANCETNIF